MLAIAALALYGRDVLHLYRSRRRRTLELNSAMARFALVNLALSAALGVALMAMGRFSEHVGAVVFLSAFGWLSGLMLAQMHKIVAFLTWLEVYGPVLGKTLTPRVQDLGRGSGCNALVHCFLCRRVGRTGALLAGNVPIFRIAALAMMVATSGLVRK
jgi:hypothetical protein